MRLSPPHITDASWYLRSSSERQSVADKLDKSLSRMKAYASDTSANGSVQGIDYANELQWCVKYYAQLGELDSGLPRAWELLALATSGNYGTEHLDYAHNSLLLYGFLCACQGRFAEACELCAIAYDWFKAHREEYEEKCVAALAQLTGNLALSGRFDEAIRLIEGEQSNPASTLMRHPFSKKAFRLGGDLHTYRRARKRQAVT
jgi:hypothetical protein